MVPLVWGVSYFPPVQGHSRSCLKHPFKLPHLHVLRPGSLTRKKVQHTAVLQLLSDFACMCQRVGTGGSYVFYFGICLRCRFNACDQNDTSRVYWGIIAKEDRYCHENISTQKVAQSKPLTLWVWSLLAAFLVDPIFSSTQVVLDTIPNVICEWHSGHSCV